MVSPDLYSIGAQLRVFITVSAYVPISVGSATLYFVSKMSLLQILHHSFYNKHVPLCLFLSISHTTIFHVHIQYSHTHTHTHIHCKHTFTVDTHSLYTHCTYTHAGIHTHYSHTHTQTHKKTQSHTHMIRIAHATLYLLSWRLEECSEYVTSVVLGTDLVARLSIHTMIKLRGEVLDCIGE